MNKQIENEKFDIAYVMKSDRGECNAIVMNIESNKKKCIENALHPLLSPDGKKILFYRKSEINSNDIIIRDLNTNEEIIVFDESYKTKSDSPTWFSYYSPAWSPDNNYIALLFYFSEESICKIGIKKTDSTSLRFLDFKFKTTLSRPTWTNDGEEIITGDVDNIYFIDIKTLSIDTIKQDSICKYDCLPQNGSQFWRTVDKKYLIFCSGAPDEYVTDFMPPYNMSVYAYNFELKRVERITPKEVYVSQACIGINYDIYFTGITSFSQKKYGIYKTNILDKNMTLIINQGAGASCRTIK